MTDVQATGAPGRAWPRWKGILLVASLALNLLVSGLFAAIGMRHGWPPSPPPGMPQATVLDFARQLPPERKREIWAAVRAERHALRPYWRGVRAAREDVRKALTAEPFDVESYRAAHDRLLEQEVQVRKAAHSLFENVARTLTPQERKAFADWQQKAERHWQQKRGNRRHHHPGAEEGEAPASAATAAQPAAPHPPAKD
jgi:uncharacterized membrane protein